MAINAGGALLSTSQLGVVNLCSRAVEAPVIGAEWMQTAWLAPSCFGRPVSGNLAASVVGVFFSITRAKSLARLSSQWA
jgi:hypothetical protein